MAIEALQLKEAYQEEKRLYLECKNIEKYLLCYMQDAIEDKYIEPLVDEYSNLLQDNMPIITQYLNYNYEKVRSEEVMKKEAEVIAMTWKPSDPLAFLSRLI